MEKNQINDYIEKLKELEKELSSDEPGDFSLFSELDGLLSTLNRDVQNAVMTNANTLNIKIKKLHKDSVTPTYAKNGDAGMDLMATSIISETTTDVTYGMGIALEIPRGFVGLIFPRSSVRKYDLALTNCVGVIDSGYRGELQATFKKTNWLKGDSSEKYQTGDRIAQIMIIPYPQIQFEEVIELSNSERGVGGFGSTGA